MFAAIDEAAEEVSGGIYYVVAAAVTIADRVAAGKAALEVIGDSGRTRPFHWREEGGAARRRMMDCLVEVGAVAHVAIHFPTGRRKQEDARADGMRAIIPCLVHDGVSELVIETRQPRNDVRDRVVILNTLEQIERPHAFTYDWLPKTEPGLWLADGLCGAVHGFVTGQSTYYEQLRESGVIDQPIYLAPKQPQKLR